MSEAILAAARVIMQRDGVAALNLHEIARMVGVRTPALYRYFPSKAAIYDDLFRRGMIQVREMHLDVIRRYPPSWERLRAWVEGRLTFAQENPDLEHLLFGRDVPGFVPTEASMAEGWKVLQVVTESMREVIDAGVINPDMPLERARDLFLSVTSGLASQHMANEPDLPVGQGRFGSLIPDVMRLFQAAWMPVEGDITEKQVGSSRDPSDLHKEATTMTNVDTTTAIIDASSVTPATPEEAAALASAEIARLLSLLESFSLPDWDKPTYCTLWDVKQVVAHIGGALSAYADWDRLLERSRPWTEGKADEPGVSMPVFLADVAAMPEERRRAYAQAGFIPLDALNQYEVDERAAKTPAELLAELRSVAPAAIGNRLRLPRQVRSLLLPVMGAQVPVSYLLDVIYPRDIWMHRIELALSTGHPVTRTAEHDGRLTALVMRDLTLRLSPVLGDRAVIYHLTGPDGGSFRYGAGASTEVEITMDSVDFHMLASGRRTAGDAFKLAHVSGDRVLAEVVLKNTMVVY